MIGIRHRNKSLEHALECLFLENFHLYHLQVAATGKVEGLQETLRFHPKDHWGLS